MNSPSPLILMAERKKMNWVWSVEIPSIWLFLFKCVNFQLEVSHICYFLFKQIKRKCILLPPGSSECTFSAAYSFPPQWQVHQQLNEKVLRTFWVKFYGYKLAVWRTPWKSFHFPPSTFQILEEVKLECLQ